MPTPALATMALSALKKPLADLYSASKNGVKRKLRELTAEARLKEIAKAICSVQKVKTMWRIDKEVPLQSFYYPSKVVIGNQPKGINNISEISETGNFVVQGTVGQGKSIFLRYLCIKELAAARRIPVFFELRRYNPKDSFVQFLINGILGYRIPCDQHVFEYLADSGKLALLLDAFDEVEPESVGHVITEIESLAQKFPKMQIVVTSRPDSGIQRSPHFRVYQLAPLTPHDHKPFLETIVDDKTKVKELLNAIEKSSGKISSLLQTPLLMSLLVIIYNATQAIPSSLSEFYDALFETLLTRHDKTKPGFSRKRASQLSDSELKRIFEAFCYAARQQDQLILNVSSAAKLLQRASEVTDIKCKPEFFLSDITKLACLMQQEGFEYHFIHKSVVEFHAASFIGHASEENAQKFYAGILSSKWAKWRQELEFLSQIDRQRYLKYFFIPSCLDAMRSLETDLEGSTEIDEAAAIRILDGIIVVPSPKTRAANDLPVHFTFRSMGGFVANSVEMSAFQRVFSAPLWNRIADFEGLSSQVGMGTWLDSKGGLEHGLRAVRAAVSSARTNMQRARADMALEARVLDFVAP